MASKKLRQAFISREALPGNVVATATLIAAASGKIRAKEPKLTATVEEYDREIDFGSLEDLEPIVGKVEMDASLSIEFAGSTTASVAPNWAPIMEASGFRQCIVSAAPWNGTFGGTATGTAKVAVHGDIWQTAAAAKTFRILTDTYEGRTTLYVEQLTGAAIANTDVLFPSASDAIVGPTVTVNAVTTAAAGFGWYPNNRPIGTADTTGLTGTIAPGDELRGGTSGAIIRYAGTSNLSNGAARQFYLIDGTPTSTGETFTNLSQTGSTAVTTGTWVTLEMPSLSFGLSEDVRTKIAKGVRWSAKLSAERGKPAFLDFTGKGIFSAVSDLGQVQGITSDSKVPPRFQGIGFVLMSYVSGEPGYYNFLTAHTPRLVSISLDMNSPPVTAEDATQSTGIQPCAFITNTRKGQGAIKFDTRPEGSFPAIKKMINSESFGLFWRHVDSTNGPNNAFLISAPGCKFVGNNLTDQNNILQDDITFRFNARRPDGTDGDGRSLVILYLFSGTANW